MDDELRDRIAELTKANFEPAESFRLLDVRRMPETKRGAFSIARTLEYKATTYEMLLEVLRAGRTVVERLASDPSPKDREETIAHALAHQLVEILPHARALEHVLQLGRREMETKLGQRAAHHVL